MRVAIPMEAQFCFRLDGGVRRKSPLKKMPRFKRNFEAVEPTKGLSRFGKVKGMRGKGFFGKAKKECPRRIEILSRMTLGLSLVFVISCALCFVPFWLDWAGGALGLSIISSFFAAMSCFSLIPAAINRRSTDQGGRGLSEAGQQVLTEDHHTLES